MDTCRLFFLGFDKVKELVVYTPVSDSELNSSLISSSCFPKIVDRVDPPGKVAVFKANFSECGAHKEVSIFLNCYFKNSLKFTEIYIFL